MTRNLIYQKDDSSAEEICKLTESEYSLLSETNIPGYINSSECNVIKINGFFEPSKKVPNVWRYNLVRKENEGQFRLKELLEKDFEKSKFNDKTVDKDENLCLLIMESPHKDEYSKDGFEPIAPAQGITGRNISLHLEYIFNNFIKPTSSTKNYKVIICNPVQFQTSLWFIHRKALKNAARTLRNKVWKWYFEKNGKVDFLNWIMDLKPKFIINACTSDLKNIVALALIEEKDNFADTKIFECSHHPAAWRALLKITKIY